MAGNTERTATTCESAAWSPSPRLVRLHTRLRETTPGLGAERAFHYTEFFRSRADAIASADIRLARALAYHLQRRSIEIYEDELIVGTHTEHRVGAICHIELTGSHMLEDIFRFHKRSVNPLALEPSVRSKLLRRVIPYWLRRNLVMQAFGLFGRLRYSIDQLNAVRYIINEAGGIAHFLPDYAGLLAVGTEGLRAAALTRAEGQDLTAAQRDFLEARLIALDAIEAFAARYLALAQSRGLERIVRVLERSPRKPATTLHEALQTLWFFQMFLQMESLDQGISLGRLDQILLPVFRMEQGTGAFDATDFRELLCDFSLKLSSVVPLLSQRITRYHGGLPSGQAVTIGGITADGACAANDLTFIMLEVMDRFKVRQPNWHARISERSRPEYVRQVLRVLSGGGGSPALYNDEVIAEALRRRGFPEANLYDYATVGCVEPALPGRSFTSSDAAIVNLPVVLERVLRKRGAARRIRSSESLLCEFEQALRVHIEDLHKDLCAIERAHARFHPTPISSLLVRGCLERARDLTAGGADHNASGIQGAGLADVADSVYAIDQLVFRRGRHTLADFVDGMRCNFQGSRRLEMLRERAASLPAYGNDVADADDIAARVAEIFDRVVSAKTNTRGGPWLPGLYSMTCHRAFGERTGALPSGRRRGEPFADGISCVDGRDRTGPTAFFNSAARLPGFRFANGVNLNVRFDAGLLRDGGPVVLEGLIRSYFARGGMQVQFNVLDPDILLDALQHPERHRNLLVRVSGYCAYFADLSPEMQREIAGRTAHRLGTATSGTS